MMCCLDVDYRSTSVVAAGVCFTDWNAEFSFREYSIQSHRAPEAYEAGNFYRRELPYLLAVLGQLQEQPTTILVDGFVSLGIEHPGLGAHLYEALEHKTPVIGVAKTRFAGDDWSERVLRGESVRPIYVTAIGMDLGLAATRIKEMPGSGRIPLPLAFADRAASF